jgi:hypothetical protein
MTLLPLLFSGKLSKFVLFVKCLSYLTMKIYLVTNEWFHTLLSVLLTYVPWSVCVCV